MEKNDISDFRRYTTTPTYIANIPDSKRKFSDFFEKGYYKLQKDLKGVEMGAILILKDNVVYGEINVHLIGIITNLPSAKNLDLLPVKWFRIPQQFITISTDENSVYELDFHRLSGSEAVSLFEKLKDQVPNDVDKVLYVREKIMEDGYRFQDGDDFSINNENTESENVNYHKEFLDSNVFIGSADWGGSNQEKRFIKDKIWQAKSQELRVEISNRVNVFDIIILKRIPQSGVLEIISIGIIQSKDTKELNVDWLDFSIKINIKDKAFYDLEFAELNKHHKNEILGELSQTVRVRLNEVLESRKQYRDRISDANKDSANENTRKEEDDLNEKRNSSIKLNTDLASSIDELGRKPFVEILHQYISNMWKEGEKENEEKSFTIHINGEWGSGKSTVLNLLKSDLENTNEWLVVEFNAWQNQHIEEPWWLFLDKVYRRIKEDKNWCCSVGLSLREWWWRSFSTNRVKLFSSITFFILGILLVFAFRYDWLNVEDSNDGKEVKSIILLVSTILTFIISVWSFLSGIIHSLLASSDEAAINYLKNARDPMESIRKHYRQTLFRTGKNIAVFIDDLDRCNPAYVIKLLEGIQTIFRVGNVLYVIAGDENWIRESFEIGYKDLKEVVNRPGQSLGNLFLEKSLQQTVNLPVITEEIKSEYWELILTGQKREQVISSDRKSELKSKAEKQYSSQELENELQDLTESEINFVREESAKYLASEENVKELEHELMEFTKYLEPNPRSMKRLANNLALERAVNRLSGFKNINDKDLIRWAIFKNSYPLAEQEILNENRSIEEVWKEIPNCKELLESVNVSKIREIKKRK